jgi:hypothetical protein
VAAVVRRFLRRVEEQIGASLAGSGPVRELIVVVDVQLKPEHRHQLSPVAPGLLKIGDVESKMA